MRMYRWRKVDEPGPELRSNRGYEEVDAAVLRPLSRGYRMRVLVMFLLLPAALVYALQTAGAFSYLEQKAFGLRMNIHAARNSQLASQARKRIVLAPLSEDGKGG